MIRDNEIVRLQKYAESLGVKVFWRQHRAGLAGAMWRIEDEDVSLVMYTWPRQSKTMLILNFLHELAHHLAYVYQGRELSKSALRAFSKEEYELTEHERYIIYEIEKDDAKYRKTIAYELGLKIPEWRINADIETDTWFYYRFWKDGVYPTSKEINEKNKEFKRRERAKI